MGEKLPHAPSMGSARASLASVVAIYVVILDVKHISLL
jgi:hypothetical protein